MPPDENPTEILELDDDLYDDLYDEELDGERGYLDDEADDYDERGEHAGYDGYDGYDRYDDHGDYRDHGDYGDYRDYDEYDEYGDYGERDEDDRAEPEYFADDRDGEELDGKKGGRGRRLLKWVAALALLGVLAAGAYFGARELLGFGYDDYEGKGKQDVLLHVEDGDITSAIANKLVEMDVVASPEAFVQASEEDERVLSIQPGYYQVKTKMSGDAAVSALVQPDSRVGHLQIKAGAQLSDVIQPDDSVTPGVFQLLADASCATVNGEDTCVSVEELHKAADSADPADLGVPEWAVKGASNAEDGRVLEGLIAPGVYDIKPGGSAEELLSQVLEKSVLRLEAAGLPSAADETPHSPYQTLVIASIIEKEAVKNDFSKVSSVIENRLEINLELGMDSTVNYLLERPRLTTADEDRAKRGPYNTYERFGLPPTPIAAPSAEAIEAALDPADTDYLFFVKCEKNGLSCFNTEYADHLADRDKAREQGVY